jgi:hypothetical protein
MDNRITEEWPQTATAEHFPWVWDTTQEYLHWDDAEFSEAVSFGQINTAGKEERYWESTHLSRGEAQESNISADDLISAAKRSVGSAGRAKELIVSEKSTTIYLKHPALSVLEIWCFTK